MEAGEISQQDMMKVVVNIYIYTETLESCLQHKELHIKLVRRTL